MRWEHYAEDVPLMERDAGRKEQALQEEEEFNSGDISNSSTGRTLVPCPLSNWDSRPGTGQ